MEAALAAHQRRLVVVDDSDVTDDLVGDMVEVLTWFSEDAYQLAHRNLLAERRSLLARIKRIETRLAVVAGKGAGTTPSSPATTRQRS